MASFLMFFFTAYLVLVMLFKNTPLSQGLMKGFSKVHNSKVQKLFDGTRVYFQVSDNKPLPCEIHGVRFNLSPTKPAGDYDSKFYFVNERKIAEQLSLAGGSARPIDLSMQFFDFTFWRGFILAIVILLSLLLAGWIMGIKGFQAFCWSLLLLSIFCLFNYLIIVYYFRLQADQMPALEVGRSWKELIRFLYRLNNIEYIFFGAFLSYAIPNYEGIRNLIYSSRVPK